MNLADVRQLSVIFLLSLVFDLLGGLLVLFTWGNCLDDIFWMVRTAVYNYGAMAFVTGGCLIYIEPCILIAGSDCNMSAKLGQGLLLIR